MRSILISAVTAIALSAPLARGAENEATVPTYHADAARSGHYIFPGLTWANAANMRVDPAFDGRVPGNIYAQPLYWHPAGAATGLVIVATEDNVVAALDPIDIKPNQLRHFVTILAAAGRLYVAGDGRVFAFSLAH